MTAGMGPLRRIGIAAEHESPEDPEGADTRVALTPAGVEALVRHGCSVQVEANAGRALGFPDAAYRAVGASIGSRKDIYPGNDLVIKLKGPAHEDLSHMDPGSTMLCMAHVQSVPKRAEVANARGVNLIAMELIVEQPEVLTDAYVCSQLAMRQILATVPNGTASATELDVAFRGFTPEVFGALQYVARRRPRTLHMSQSGLPGYELPVSVGLAHQGCPVGHYPFDEITAGIAPSAMGEYRARYPLGMRGRRKIQSLHETGRAGALFGIELALRKSPTVRTVDDLGVSILGYGNVAFGALDECMRHGITRVDILTKRATRRPYVRSYLRSSDLIINGVEQGPRYRGNDYIITNEDLKSVLRPGSVVIDLMGGSAANRTAVEPIVECMRPGDPYSVQEGVYLASVWGWPLLGFRKESVERYSSQIVQVLLSDERLLNGWASAPANLVQALVAGPVLERTRLLSSQRVALSATLRA